MEERIKNLEKENEAFQTKLDKNVIIIMIDRKLKLKKMRN
jgi:hypothetical protein